MNGVIASVKIREPNFGKERVAEASMNDPYLPSYAIAQALNLNPLALSKVTSSFQVEIAGGQRVNLGLNLKFEARKQKVLGYSRRNNTGWEFSQKTVDLIVRYMHKFPEFFAGIQHNPHNDHYSPTDFYPEEIAISKIKDMQAWLKEIEAKSFERVPLDAEQLDSSVVKLIEKDATQLSQKPEAMIIPKKLRGVPRSALLRPSDVEQRLGNQSFSLGDRVVYAQDSGKVPIAMRGTVVGMTRTPGAVLLDVVFDSSFMSGTTLGDRCSPFRGQTVPDFSVVNVTYKQLVTGTRATASHQAQQHPAPIHFTGYGAPIGPNGQGQLREAPAPPPLTGSFRTALAQGNNGDISSNVNGHHGGMNGGFGPHTLPHRPPRFDDARHFHNGSRGRGRGGRGGTNYTRTGYIALSDDDPQDGVVDGNPNFRPRNYTRVPPPQDNHHNRRGRGGLLSRGSGRPRV